MWSLPENFCILIMCFDLGLLHLAFSLSTSGQKSCWWDQQTHCYHCLYFFIGAVQLMSPCSIFDLTFKCYWNINPGRHSCSLSHIGLTQLVKNTCCCIQHSFIINVINQLKMRELFFFMCFYLFEYKRWAHTSVYKSVVHFTYI